MTIATIALDPSTATPLHRQLYEGLREAILAGRLPAGMRLPSTRALARDLAISRNTVLDAYAQLLAEGYVVGKIGSGTYVARALPEDLLHVDTRDERPPPGDGDRAERRGRTLSRRGELLAGTRVSPPTTDHRPPSTKDEDQAVVGRRSSVVVQRDVISLRPGQPDLNALPFEIWRQITARHWQRPSHTLLTYSDPAGYGPLRAAITAYLGAARAVRCDASQVIIVSGSQQALDLTARVLLDEGDAVWMEEPGYVGARGALLGAGARVIPVPIDREGLDITAGVAQGVRARLAYVTPSHQYPLGVTMSLGRRLALLEWAGRAGAWVVEDDYDSEYRYAGRPLAALQGLDTEGRVIYIGTFSKVLFPGLRLGYLVTPPDLTKAFIAARALADRHSPGIDQAILADFIAEGHFVRHIRRMRAIYMRRQAALIEAAAHDLAGLLDVSASEAGMHLVGWLPEGLDDRAASRRAAAYGVDAPPLSLYTTERPQRGGLLLGYTALDEDRIREGVRRLATALKVKS